MVIGLPWLKLALLIGPGGCQRIQSAVSKIIVERMQMIGSHGKYKARGCDYWIVSGIMSAIGGRNSCRRLMGCLQVADASLGDLGEGS